ncbi:MAG: DEAD/DEAH box helicase [Oligoflexales bacterium]
MTSMPEATTGCLIQFDKGTLVFEGLADEVAKACEWIKWDERSLNYRAAAFHYRDILLAFRDQNLPYQDKARGYGVCEDAVLSNTLTLRSHQRDAFVAWRNNQYIGTVCLPTGAGKTILAVYAIQHLKRDTLVVVPTIDLLQQWESVLKKNLPCEIGVLGGGSRTILPITVATYDSAMLHCAQIGNRFGLVVFDECHHLPAPQYQNVARALISPFRLGLSATIERADGKESLIYELVGKLVFEGQIDQMDKNVLAPYDVVNIQVELTDQEKVAYEQNRKIYVSFIRRSGIQFNRPDGWQEFIRKSSWSPEGRQAFQAYLEQKRLAQGAEGKLKALWDILLKHREDSMIIFTNDNAFAYRIGKEFVLPVLTHNTRPAERKKFLESFREGVIRVLVTSKVLNEGVDVPEASIGVVVSGSGGVREHVQRLGRILRHKPNKRAVLYELVAKDTSELNVNRRRRRHHAYESANSL